MHSPSYRLQGAMTLTFRLGPILVCVHIWFLFAALLLGLGSQRGPIGVGLWASGFLVTIFAHELAHAVAALRFGAPAEVQLTLFRVGLGSRLRSLSPLRRVVVCLAGPAVSLLVAATVFAIAHAHPPASEMGVGVLHYLGWINLGWGLLNLAPILPLDGAYALVAFLDGTTKGRGELPVRWLSVGCAAALGLVAVHSRMMFPGFICGLVAFQNAQALRALGAENPESTTRVKLQTAYDAIERGDVVTAIGHCRSVLNASTVPATRKDAVRLLAYAYASTAAWGKLMDLLESGSALLLEDEELEKYERAAREVGRPDEAQRIALLRNHVSIGP
jgi:stage IV sporulation protein FB